MNMSLQRRRKGSQRRFLFFGNVKEHTLDVQRIKLRAGEHFPALPIVFDHARHLFGHLRKAAVIAFPAVCIGEAIVGIHDLITALAWGDLTVLYEKRTVDAPFQDPVTELFVRESTPVGSL